MPEAFREAMQLGKREGVGGGDGNLFCQPAMPVIGDQAVADGPALHALPDGAPIPWQRVLNARGEVSLPGPAGARQRALLAAEGVAPEPSGRIDLKHYQWRPRAPAESK